MPYPVAAARSKAAAQAAAAQLLIHDTFTGSGNLTAHAIDPVNVPSVSWVVTEGSWTITSNQARAAQNYCGATVDIGTPNAEIEVTFVMNSIMQVLGRYVSASEYWYINFRNTWFEIADASGARASENVTLTNGQTYTATIRFAGNTVTATINGATVSFDGCVGNGTRFGIYAVFFDSRFETFKATSVVSDITDYVNLKNNLLAYWSMNEASGVRVDSHGSHSLADPSGVGSNTGKVYANSIEIAAEDKGFTIDPPGDLNFGNNSFTVGLWIRWHGLPSAGHYENVIGSAYLSVDGGFQIKLAYNGALAFICRNTPAVNGIVHCQLPTVDTWYNCVFWYNATAKTVNAALNGSLLSDTISWTNGILPCVTPVKIGYSLGGDHEAPNYRLGPVAVWSRTLTSAEKIAWHNWSAGLVYSAFA